MRLAFAVSVARECLKHQIGKMESLRSLGQILDAVRALSDEEREHLRALLNETGSDQTEEAFARDMVKQGLLTRRAAGSPSGEAPAFQPVRAQGRPATEIIIEQRR